MSTGAQFGRVYSLILANHSSQAIDLSSLRFTFQITANDVETPNTAIIKVYNLSDNTASQAIKEFDTVVLQAGYQNGNIGVIFKGTIKQFWRGRERNVDSFLEIDAVDGDLGYNFGVVNTSEAGATPEQQLNTYAQAMGLPVDKNAAAALSGNGGVVLNPRGKAAFGLARLYMRRLMTTYNCRWSIQNGVVTVIPNDGFLPGEATVINSKTGMIGVPTVTDDGIHVQVLLNPSIQVGRAVRLNNRDITNVSAVHSIASNIVTSFPSFTSPPQAFAKTSEDGIYRVLVVEHEGDTRGQAWYSHLTCLSLDPSTSKPNN